MTAPRAAEPQFTYDLATHQFWLDGVRCWGITSALSAAGKYGDMSRIPAFYRDRGKATALAIELYECGDLNPDSLDEHTKPALDQWCRFRDRHVDAVLAVEAFTWSMAGTVPYVVIIDALCRMRSGQVWLIDVKRGKNKPAYGLQTAAQELAVIRCTEGLVRPDARGVLELTDKDFAWVPHRRGGDYVEVNDLIATLGPRDEWKKEETAA